MLSATPYGSFATTAYANVLDRDRVMDIGIRPLWTGMPRIAGPAYTAGCAPGDNLMLHAAIYRAPAGSIVVVAAADVDYALAGGNVCAVAQRNGIAGFVVDGVVRDLREIRELGFPVFARGVIPKPGTRDALGTLAATIRCGGVAVAPDDIVIADEEGIVVLPLSTAMDRFAQAQALEEKEAAQTLDDWEANHRRNVDAILAARGYPA